VCRVHPPVCQQGEASEKLPPLPTTGALCVAFIPPAFENLAITPQEPIE
jgi:hypothetical protein